MNFCTSTKRVYYAAVKKKKNEDRYLCTGNKWSPGYVKRHFLKKSENMNTHMHELAYFFWKISTRKETGKNWNIYLCRKYKLGWKLDFWEEFKIFLPFKPRKLFNILKHTSNMKNNWN